MGIMVEGRSSGAIFVLVCVCCSRDIRLPASDGIAAALEKWPGIHGNYLGKRELICDYCLNEAKTGEHVPYCGETRELPHKCAV